MKTLGFLLLIGGISFGVYALNMDTSVKVDYPMGNIFNLPERVNNIGLMNDRQNYLIFSGIISILGAIMFFATKSSSKKASNETDEANNRTLNSNNESLNLNTDTQSLLNQLSQLFDLRGKNIITEEIYEQERQTILAKLQPIEQTKEEAMQTEELIPVLAPEDEAQSDFDYEMLFNNKSWFQKNKTWIVGVSTIFFAGLIIWYLINNETKPQETAQIFTVDKATVKNAFLQYLPDISGGRKLNTYFKTSDGNGYKIVIGDLNGDNLNDAVVDYSLEPTDEDNGGGGHAISEISGLIVFLNTGNSLTIADHSDNFGGNFGSRNELKKINNGVIFLEGLDYAENDARCCPSIKTIIKVVLRNNKLTELK